MFIENISLKQFCFLMLNCKFKKCELWTYTAYTRVHHHTKSFRSHMIASAKMDLLTKAGLEYSTAQKLVIMEGNQRINKKNLSLLGVPIWTGTLDELFNYQNLWNESVCDCYVKGFFRKKLQIIINDADTGHITKNSF